jgi:Family of unknown function (DUF6011)
MSAGVRRWRWVLQDGRSLQDGGRRLHDVGILEDGTLHNPNGYPEAVVRAAIQAAEVRLHARRSQSALRAGEARRRRRERKVYLVARGISSGRAFGPQTHCVICWKWLSDPDSITRGIGSDCWQAVLADIEQQRAAELA